MIDSILAAAAIATLTNSAPGTVIRSDTVCNAEANAPSATSEARLAYRDLGPSEGAPVLLIAGTDQQMLQWPTTLLEDLRSEGWRPIIYDARDVGCSHHHEEAGPVDWASVFSAMGSGSPAPLPYDLNILAADALALLDHLGIRRAAVIGVSGGATVASELAAAHPDRVARLVLVMANSGNPQRPMPSDPARIADLPSPPPSGAPHAAVVSWRVKTWGALSDDPDSSLNDIAEKATMRSWDPDGTARAGASLLVAGDRRTRLASVAAPTLVIHGENDPLISLDAGRDVAEAVPGAAFVTIPGMGHTLTDAAMDAILLGLHGVDRAASAE